MKKYLLTIIAMVVCANIASAQNTGSIDGRVSNDIAWTFDGHTLTLSKTDIMKRLVRMPDYNIKDNLAPWSRRHLPIKKILVGEGIANIGACAFAECDQLETVEFKSESSVDEIGWGSFLRCRSLFNFSIPPNVRKIGKIAFAECQALRSVTIPKRTRVEDYAFLSCPNLTVVAIAINAQLGKGVFATEVKSGKKTGHTFYHGEIRGLPANVNEENCHVYGLSKAAVADYLLQLRADYQDADDAVISEVDDMIPSTFLTRNDTYALVIGNQHYRFAPDVPFARHDARIFAEYCKKTLGIPAEHIHLCEDATKTMILEHELEDWLAKDITDKGSKSLIIYYAGHGVPDTDEQNKSYLLPTDVYGTTPRRGIALDAFYAAIGNMGFGRVTVFMDACFSGVNRLGESVNHGERGTEVEAADTQPTTGNMVVFCAAQGNETAQGYQEEGHGLFTYYLLKELQQSEGQLTYGKLARHLEDAVSRTAPTLQLRKRQTPSAKATESLAGSWADTSL